MKASRRLPEGVALPNCVAISFVTEKTSRVILSTGSANKRREADGILANDTLDELEDDGADA